MPFYQSVYENVPHKSYENKFLNLDFISFFRVYSGNIKLYGNNRIHMVKSLQS